MSTTEPASNERSGSGAASTAASAPAAAPMREQASPAAALPSGPGVFEQRIRIRYSECDHTGTLTVPALINLFQDCSTFQSEELGLGVERLVRERCAWVLTHWQLVIDRAPAFNEDVTVGTFAVRFRGLTAERCFYLRDATGALIVRAGSRWAFMDLAAGRPRRPDPELIEPYGTHAALDLPAETRRVIQPADEALVPCAPVPVRRHHIDTNEHMNNGQYVAMALDLLPAELHPRSVRVDYKRSAVLGDTVRPAVAVEPARTVVVLANDAEPDGIPFAVVEFQA